MSASVDTWCFGVRNDGSIWMSIEGPTRYRQFDFGGDVDHAHLAASSPLMFAALEKIVEMNRQHAEDQYGDADKAESWACVKVARGALSAARGDGKGGA